MFAATWTPAARSSLVAFWEVAVPNTGPSHSEAAVARTRVFPVPAGPVMISTVRAEVRTCQMAAAWSSRSPRERGDARARRARGRAALPRALPRRRPGAAPPARPAGAARLAPARARPAALPWSAARWWRTARRRAGCRRCARPAGGAATRAAAATAGASRHTTWPVRPDRASSARPSSSSCAACGLICRVSGGMTRASCLTRSCRVQAGCLAETRIRALASARAWASRVGGPVGARPP